MRSSFPARCMSQLLKSLGSHCTGLSTPLRYVINFIAHQLNCESFSHQCSRIPLVNLRRDQTEISAIPALCQYGITEGLFTFGISYVVIRGIAQESLKNHLSEPASGDQVTRNRSGSAKCLRFLGTYNDSDF